MKKVLSFAFISMVCCGFGLEIPTNFKICKWTDKNVDECLVDAIQDSLPKLANGLPEFDFPPIEPLQVPAATIGEGKGTVNVIQKYKNIKIYNIPTAKINNVHLSYRCSNNTGALIEIQTSVDLIKINAEYDFNGRVLLLPITGKGDCRIEFVNTKIDIKVGGNFITKEGQPYISIDDLTLDLQPSKVVYKFENLFHGDERLSDEMHKLLNENWKNIWEDIEDGYTEFLAIIFKDVANKIFLKVPFQKIFPL